ncbi:hypothetical protein CKM354_000313300 [Cercospora kikuchii]|uniref:Uncharacterized protein n=1 Tax=Cercospora kikuchii TaxID=84275 RepID=A0A9P3CAM3_9PEZI|nr:uncharacterized protein CKM354_000313300 [Cercospora kikuchii]GIZ39762.1 hypothetical protein CKM354_000313300 [Cercospora kikuchii]
MSTTEEEFHEAHGGGGRNYQSRLATQASVMQGIVAPRGESGLERNADEYPERRAARTKTARRRSRSSESSVRRRHDFYDSSEPVPTIPTRFLVDAIPLPLAASHGSSATRCSPSTHAHALPSPRHHHNRSNIDCHCRSAEAYPSSATRIEARTPTFTPWDFEMPSSHLYQPHPNSARDEDNDYFLELADEQAAASHAADRSCSRRSMSRASFSKRRSLPAEAPRPSTSGGNACSRPPSRLDTLRASTGLFQHADLQRRASLTRTSHYDDTTSTGRSRRFSTFADRSPISPRQQRPRSPEPQPLGRRRSSSGTASFGIRHHDNQLFLAPTIESQDSPTESSGRQQTDSSVDSQTADTVWDELDELKSRIKKLECDHKKPSSSSAAASGDSGDRPRTATTAPTTITSSPKQSTKDHAEAPTTASPALPTEQNVGSLWANIHPLLHDALGRSRDSLSSTVFHNLEVVVADALNLAALAGVPAGQNANSASPQTNQAPLNERQVRRRVDNLCRNLTDLCISLRESKPSTPATPGYVASPGIVASPAQLSSPAHFPSPAQAELPTIDLPLRRTVRKSSLPVAALTPGRPMSRLEQRKSSLLGPQAIDTLANISPRGSHGDLSGSEAQSTPTHSATLQPPHRISAVPSRALRSRMQQNHDTTHEERALRAPSRAMTDFSSSFRANTRLASQDRSPGAQRQMPSLRDSLASRRKYDTSPVLEEDASSPVPQPRTRIFSSGQTYNKVPSRTSSIIRSKHLME